jgi:outer membrane protein assembly factor BamB
MQKKKGVLKMWRQSCVVILVVLPAWASVGRSAEIWVSFHNAGSASVNSRHLPLHWAPGKGICWNVDLPGYGQSAPVVWHDQVFVTAVEGDRKESNIVIALNAATGEEVWRRTFPATVMVRNSYMVSRAAPTPLVDKDHVYVLFESGDLHAISHEGELKWHRSLFDSDERAFQNGHGYGASPTQTNDAVIILVDHRGPSYVTSVDKQTGDERWKTDRSSRSSWSSPQVAHIGNHQQIVISSSGTVDGYDATTGQQLWSLGEINGNVIPSLTVAGDRIFVGASIARDDSNASSAANSNCCLQITPNEAPGYRVLWRAEKAVCDYASPLLHEKHVYYVNKVGVVYCLEAATGRQCYVRRVGSPCWAQPIGAAEHIYFFGKNGDTSVLRAGPTFELLASNSLWADDALPKPIRSYEYEPENENDPRPRTPVDEYIDPIVYAAVAIDEAFFVRLGTHLYRIGEERLPINERTANATGSSKAESK